MTCKTCEETRRRLKEAAIRTVDKVRQRNAKKKKARAIV